MNRPVFYTLDQDNKPVPQHAFPIAPFSNQLALDSLVGITISTVFLGIDHNHGPGSDPVLWETAIFAEGEEIDIFNRYTSHEDAMAGHQEAIAHVNEQHLEPLEDLKDELSRRLISSD